MTKSKLQPYINMLKMNFGTKSGKGTAIDVWLSPLRQQSVHCQFTWLLDNQLYNNS
jgi:hypothetical protein